MAAHPPPSRRRRRPVVAATAAVLVVAGALVATASVTAATGAAAGAATTGGTSALPAAGAPTVAAAGEPDPDAQLPVSDADPEEVRRTADDILAGQEYQPPEKSLFTRIMDWLAEKLGELFGRSVTPSGGGERSIGAWLVVAVLVALAGFIAWRFARTTRRVARDEDEPFDIEITALRTPAGWAQEAERFEASGAWKEALRARYRALLADLLDRGVVDDLPGRTTGEYRVLVRRSAPGASGSFAGACELFERAWYGNLPSGRDECLRLRALADETLAALDDGAGEPTDPAPMEVPA